MGRRESWRRGIRTTRRTWSRWVQPAEADPGGPCGSGPAAPAQKLRPPPTVSSSFDCWRQDQLQCGVSPTLTSLHGYVHVAVT